MIKDLGGDFSRGKTTLACMGGCCCCCCLQTAVAAYWFGGAGGQISRGSLGNMGPATRALAILAPIAGISLMAVYGATAGSLMAGAFVFLFIAPIAIAVLALLAWLGAVVGTFVDSASSGTSATERLDELGRFGSILGDASIKSIVFGVFAFIVSIPAMILFLNPLGWLIMALLVVTAAVSGWDAGSKGAL